MTFGERIYKRRTELKLTQDELARRVGYKSRSTIAKIESGDRDVPQSTIVDIAKALDTTPSYLMGWGEESITSNVASIITDGIYNIPVFENVSAGFGAYACSDIVDYIPVVIASPTQARDTIAIRVKGNSMYPKIEDGDTIVVQRMDSVDSGSIAVVMLDGEEALVKKVEYGEDWINLISINPEYPIRHFENEEVIRLSVVGKVKQIIKTV